MTLTRIFCICCIMMLILCSWSFAYDNRPIVILRHDDGWLNCRNAFPEFGNKSFLELGKELKIPITWAIITDRTSNGTALSWAELIDYVTNAGGELASHSATHTPLNSLEAYIDDVLLSKAAIEANTPFTCNTFLQPGTWTGDAYFNSFAKMDNILGKAIQNNFQQSQLYLGKLGIGPPVYKHGLSANFDIDYINRPMLTDFLKAIDYISQTPGLIYEIQFHGIQSPTSSEDYCTRADFMAALLTKLNQLRNDGTIRLLSINEAYNNNNFSPDVNRVFDPGFELYSTNISKYVPIWILDKGNTILDQVGYNNTKCCRIIQGGDLHQALFLPSGRYKLTWMQRPDNGTKPDNSVKPLVIATNLVNNIESAVIAYPVYKNTSDTWEEKNIVLKIPDKAHKVYTWLYSTGPFLVDNISLQQMSADTDKCVSNFKVTPLPNGMQLKWRAPDNTQYKNIHLKYSLTQKSPQTPDEGTTIEVTAADNGKEQSLFYPFNWKGKTSVYLSAFAVKQDNTYSEPDIDYILVDQSKPLVSNLRATILDSKTVYASWTIKANASDIHTTRYSVGTTPSESDVVNWTTNNDGSATIKNLTPRIEYYLNVQTQNAFGIWSDITSVPFTISDQALLHPPYGTHVITTGVVSAIFNGFYYIQSKDGMIGIKVVGPTDSISLGMNVTVSGILDTELGERHIDIQHSQP